MHAYLVQCAKSHSTVSTDENSDTLEGSALNDGRSLSAMFLTFFCKVEGLETETLTFDLAQ